MKACFKAVCGAISSEVSSKSFCIGKNKIDGPNYHIMVQLQLLVLL